jgi:glucose-1-phosphate thymidylyltransferase
MKCILLGAGYATRLYPLTLDRPKPLLPVGGVPILERICERVFEVSDVDSVYVVTNHRFSSHYLQWLEDYRRRSALPVPVEILDDGTTSPETRLGAIGDIQFVLDRARITGNLMVIAGDNLFEGGLQGLVSLARSAGTSVGLTDLKSTELVSLYGAVKLDGTGRISGFEEKPRTPKSTLVATGAYVFREATLPYFRRYLDAGDGKDAPGYFLQWLYPKVPVFGYRMEGGWYDIGDIASYRRADESFTSARSP